MGTLLWHMLYQNRLLLDAAPRPIHYPFLKALNNHAQLHRLTCIQLNRPKQKIAETVTLKSAEHFAKRALY